MPQALGHPVTHLWLLRGMARGQGIDLAETQAEGRLSQAAWSGMVTACRACPDAAACARLLGRATRFAIPDACVNRAALIRLMPTEVA